MPRKSAILRLSQAAKLFSGFREAGLADTYQAKFIKDAIARLNSGRGLSKKQRDWLDNLIEDGVPKPRNTEQVARLEAAAAVAGMEGKANILNDFANKYRNGWSLSEKQIGFMNKLVAESDALAITGPYAPDFATIEILKLCTKLARTRSSMYWSTHAGTHSALTRAIEWLVWNDSPEDDRTPRPNLDEWCVNKLLKSFRSKLTEITNPRFLSGEMRWLYADGSYKVAVVSSGPSINDNGVIVYDALVDGKLITTSNLVKSRRG
jgi:hypothetical protein